MTYLPKQVDNFFVELTLSKIIWSFTLIFIIIIQYANKITCKMQHYFYLNNHLSGLRPRSRVQVLRSPCHAQRGSLRRKSALFLFPCNDRSGPTPAIPYLSGPGDSPFDHPVKCS